MLTQWYSIELDLAYCESRTPRYDYSDWTRSLHKAMIQDAAAAVPNWGKFGGINDRMCYGRYDNDRVWANSMFPLVEKWVKTELGKKQGLHSESYLQYIRNER